MRVREALRALRPRRSQQGWLGGVLVGHATGVGLCASIAVVLCVAHVLDTRDAAAARSRNAAAPIVDAAAPTAQPAVAAITPAQKPIVPDRTEIAAQQPTQKTTPDPITQPRVQQAPARPGGPPATTTPGADRFALAPPPAETPNPYFLPKKPWFALADLAIAEPESCRTSQTVCAINRSLNTALTWAKSPAEAAPASRTRREARFLDSRLGQL